MTASNAHFTETARVLLERDDLAVYEKAFAEGLADFGKGLSDEIISRERSLPLSTVQRWRKIGIEHGDEALEHLGAGARFLTISFEEYDSLARHLRYPFRTRFEKATCALAALARGAFMAELAKSWGLGAGLVLTWKAAFEKGGIVAVAAAEGVPLEEVGATQAMPEPDVQEVQPELPLLVQKSPEHVPEPLPPIPQINPQIYRRAEDGRRVLENTVRPPFAPEKRLAEKQSTLLFPEPQRKNGQTVKRSPIPVMRKGRIHGLPRKNDRPDEPERIIEPIKAAGTEPEQVREITILEPINWPMPSYYPEPEPEDDEAGLADVTVPTEDQALRFASPLPETDPDPAPEPDAVEPITPEMPAPSAVSADTRRTTKVRRASKSVVRRSAGTKAPPPRSVPTQPPRTSTASAPPPAAAPSPADPPASAGSFFSGKNAHRWHAVMELRASGNMRAVTSKYGVSSSTLEKWVVAYATSPAARA